MSDFSVVHFKGIGHELTFNVPSVLAELSFFGHPVTIQFYGAIIAFGFILAVLFGGRIAWKWKMSIDKMIDVLIYGTVAGIIGARAYYVISEWDFYKLHPGEIPAIWHGGLAIYGGLIGGLAAAFIVCKVRKMNFYNLLDIAAMSFLLAQGIGRWGNFTNQEAFGVNTNMPWGMKSAKTYSYLASNLDLLAQRGMEADPNGYVHPTFLYESLWCLLGFVLLYIICRKFRRFSGQIFLCYGIWYGLERMIVEGLRTDSLYIGHTTLRVSQLLSAALVVVCTALLIAKLRKYIKNPQPIDGVDFFLELELKKQAEAKKEKEQSAQVTESTENTEDNEGEKNNAVN